MSEFRQEWPVTTSFPAHLEYINQGLEVINNELLLPSDRRWDIAYGSLVMGGQDGAVFAEGQPGAGKTAFGNIVMGEGNRVDIASTDTSEILEGYESPVDHKFVAPKLVLDQADVRLFLNELSHLRDTGPLHKYWDGEELVINGKRYQLADASIYATANFPDGGRSKPIDPAMRSRMAISVLAGDNGKDTAAQLHSLNGGIELDERFRDGLLPPAKIRRGIRAGMTANASMNAVGGQYVANVLDAINDNPLMRGVDLNDRRTSKGWAQAVRAHRLVAPEARRSGAITTEELARVASLALGSIVSLSSRGMRELRQSNEPMDQLTASVLARRMVAGIAMRELLALDDMGKRKNADEVVADFMQKRSYASLIDNRRTDELMVDAIVKTKPSGESQDVPKRKWSFGRRSR